jgi:hypothetical protein
MWLLANELCTWRPVGQWQWQLLAGMALMMTRSLEIKSCAVISLFSISYFKLFSLILNCAYCEIIDPVSLLFYVSARKNLTVFAANLFQDIRGDIASMQRVLARKGFAA